MAHGSTRSLQRAGAKLVHAPCLGCEQSASPRDPHGRLPGSGPFLVRRWNEAADRCTFSSHPPETSASFLAGAPARVGELRAP